ncbi:MAG: UvrD-helicase domain-containing protein [Planctomycetota bacterium]|nr:UvrD-helicase domain-containing protein [Planctomycetota bacterium]
MNIPREVIQASAGTGKTYCLVSRYVELVSQGVDPRTILATTFTRKAAGEILGRVLLRLAGERGEEDAVCLSSLVRVVDALGSLAVQTLDSYASRLAGAFPLEIALTPGWEIAESEEMELLRGEAIEQAMEEGDPRTLFDLIEMLQGTAGTRSIHRRVETLVNTAYNAYLECREVPEVWSRIGPSSRPLRSEVLQAGLDRLEKAEDLLARTQAGQINKSWKKAHDKSLQLAREEDWEAFLDAGLPGAIRAKKDTFGRQKIGDELLEIYRPLVDHAAGLILGELLRRNQAIRELMERFDRAFRELKRGRGRYQYSDIPEALLLWAGQVDSGAIDGRLSTPFEHVLLDEFQDTSRVQFELLEKSLKRVIENSESGSILCVGDPKQSLYRWRQAEPALLDGLLDRWPQMQGAPMSLNWRSSEVVLDAVNRVFGSLSRNGALGDHVEAVAAWKADFQPHTAAKDCGGAVNLWVGPDCHGEKAEERPLRFGWVADRVVEWVRETPEASVGILVRKGATIRTLRNELESRGLAVSEEGGNPLTDTVPVQRFADLLQFAWRPGDEAAAYRLVCSPLGSLIGLEGWSDAPHRAQVSSRWRARFVREGFARPFRQLVRDTADSMNGEELGRLDQLIELAIAFDLRGEWRAGAFLRAIEQRRIENPGRERVRIMTLHASKGLQFDRVILPELDELFTRHSGTILTDRPGIYDPVQVATCYPSAMLSDLHPDLERIRNRFRSRQIHEGLCLLYVGMTRAVHSLDMVIPFRSRATGFWCDPSGVLLAALAPDQTLQAETSIFTVERGDWKTELRKEDREEVSESIELSELNLTIGEDRGGDPRPAPSRRITGPVDLGSVFQVPGRDGRDSGSLMHLWFERVGWMEDGLPPEERLREWGRQRGFEDSALDVFLTRFQTALENEEIRGLFSRAHYEAENRIPSLAREQRYAVLVDGPSGTFLERGRYDRKVVVRDREGEVQHVDLFEFKSDGLDEHPGAMERLIDSHRHQLESYRAAAVAAYRLDPARVRVWVIFTTAGRVAEVGSSTR